MGGRAWGRAWRVGMGLLMAGAGPVAQAQWNPRGEVGVLHDDNLSNAGEADDVVADSAAYFALGVSHPIHFTDTLSLRFGTRLRGEAYRHVNALNALSLGLEGALRKKWGVGPMVPWSELALTAGRDEFRATQRDAWWYQSAARLGQRMHPTLAFTGEAWVERRAAKALAPDIPGLSGDAFSQSSRGYGLQGDWDLTDAIRCTFAYRRRMGDVTLNSTGEGDEYPAAKAAAEDPTFGPAFYAYKIDGRSHVGRVALSYALSDRASLNLSFERRLTHLEGGSTYGRNLVLASLAFGF